VEPAFRHTVPSYASEVNKTVGVWRAVPHGLLDFKPHERVNTVRAILAHQLLAERFFGQFVGTGDPPVEAVLRPAGRRRWRRTSRSTSACIGGGCRSSRRARWGGGSNPGRTSAGRLTGRFRGKTQIFRRYCHLHR
jgi:hypothetical protein